MSSMSLPFHILFAGGGTIGHLTPGLAVAEWLTRLAPGVRVGFVGTGKPRERELVEEVGHEYCRLPSSPSSSQWRKLASCLWSNLCGLAGATRLQLRERVDLVVGLGGHASLPAAQAAVWLGIPLVLLEQNAVPGRVTRWLAPRAQAVCVAFEVTCTGLPKSCRALVTGNPVRHEFITACRISRQPQLAVLGGSSGAMALNRALPAALARFPDLLQGWRIVHQTGPDELDDVRSDYRDRGLVADVRPFIRHMPNLLADSDLVVSRAGGTTLAELAAAGVPGILIPYPHAADNHQHGNARQAERAGGCAVVDQLSQDFPQRLADTLRPLLTDPARRGQMAQAMQRLARPCAAEQVAQAILEIRTSHATPPARAA